MSELVLVRPGPAPLPAVYPLVLRVEYDLHLCSPNPNAYGGGVDREGDAPGARVARAVLIAQRSLEGRKKTLRQRVRKAYDAAGSPVWNVPVVVDVTVRRGDRVDETNLRAAVKAGEDALFKNRIERYVKRGDKREKIITPQRAVTPDDKPAWVEWGEITQDVQRRFRGAESFELSIWPRAILEKREAVLELIIEEARREVATGDGSDRMRELVAEGFACGAYVPQTWQERWDANERAAEKLGNAALSDDEYERRRRVCNAVRCDLLDEKETAR